MVRNPDQCSWNFPFTPSVMQTPSSGPRTHVSDKATHVKLLSKHIFCGTQNWEPSVAFSLTLADFSSWIFGTFQSGFRLLMVKPRIKDYRRNTHELTSLGHLTHQRKIYHTDRIDRGQSWLIQRIQVQIWYCTSGRAAHEHFNSWTALFYLFNEKILLAFIL